MPSPRRTSKLEQLRDKLYVANANNSSVSIFDTVHGMWRSQRSPGAA